MGRHTWQPTKSLNVVHAGAIERRHTVIATVLNHGSVCAAVLGTPTLVTLMWINKIES
jgi:hypothetical protein